MEKEIYLPEKIKNLISRKDYIANEVGMSEAKVMVTFASPISFWKMAKSAA